MIPSIVQRASVGPGAAINTTAALPDPPVEAAPTLGVYDDRDGAPLGAPPIDAGAAVHADPLKG